MAVPRRQFKPRRRRGMVTTIGSNERWLQAIILLMMIGGTITAIFLGT